MASALSAAPPIPAAVAAWRRAPWSASAVGLLLAVLLGMFVVTTNWPNTRVTQWDMFGYYLYLPSTYVYDDLAELKFVPPLLDRTGLTNRGNPAHPLGNFEVSRARTDPDRYVVKYTMGQAMLWWPFFQAAHYYTRHFGGPYPPDGYSAPYQLAMYLAGLSYALLGLGLLRRLLLRLFSDKLSAVLLVIVYLGTNYLAYSVFRSLYSHNALFVLHTATLLLLTHWLPRPRWWLAAAMGLSIGMAVLIRPSEAIILLAPLLLGVATWADLRGRLALAVKHWPQVVLAGAVAVALNVPQLLYWHRMSGHWLYDSYPGEKFDFQHPHVLDGLFSFNNGWLTYTPVMGLALIGIGLCWTQQRNWFWLPALYLSLHVVISFSWWCWWYEDSVGSRAMVQTYPLLLLPLGVCLRTLWQQRNWLLHTATALALALCILLNVFQAWQLRQGIFVTEYMTSRYYKAIFGKTALTAADLAKYDANEATPDPVTLQPEQVYFNDFSQLADSAGATREFALTPPAWRVDKQRIYSPGYQGTLGQLGLHPGDFVQGSVQAYYPRKEGDIHKMPSLVVSYERPGGTEALKWRNVRITNKIGEINTLWGGSPGTWGDVTFASEVPADARPDDAVKVYVTNGNSELPLFIDNLTVTVLRNH